MKRIKITEEQFHDLSRNEAVKVEDGGNVSQKIQKMRNDTSDMKQGELKQLAHRQIDRAFWLGIKYSKMLSNIEGRAKIMKQLDKMNKQIDRIPI